MGGIERFYWSLNQGDIDTADWYCDRITRISSISQAGIPEMGDFVRQKTFTNVRIDTIKTSICEGIAESGTFLMFYPPQEKFSQAARTNALYCGATSARRG